MAVPGAIDRVKDAGFKNVRVQILWSQTEIADDVYAWRQVDTRIPPVFARGFATLVYIHAVPGWANGGQGQAFRPTLRTQTLSTISSAI
jgi:hypothetical protein